MVKQQWWIGIGFNSNGGTLMVEKWLWNSNPGTAMVEE